MNPESNASPRLFLLGPPRLEMNGEPQHLDTRKALALLAYLALQKHEFQRDSLSLLLWPDLDQSRARATLRRTLTPLNNVLGDSALSATRDTVQLNAGYPLWTDVEAFQQAVQAVEAHLHPAGQTCPECQKHLERAAGLYRGDFMAGFTLRDSPTFDDWQFITAEQLRQQYGRVLEALAAAYQERGQPDQAVDAARRWLALDTLHEPAHRMLMRIYAGQGNRSQALRQYRECVRILDQELGVQPLEETTRLYEAILDTPGQLLTAPAEAPPRSQPVQPRPGSSRPPLIGREAAWRSLRQAYERGRSSGQFVSLEGEIGIGKTRMTEELIGYAQKDGAHILAVRCFEGEKNLAYAPIIAALRAALQLPGSPPPHQRLAPIWRQELSRLLPELLPSSSGQQEAEAFDPVQAQGRLFESVRQFLLSIGPPLLVVFDDFQWMDSASVELIAYLVRRLPSLPLLLVSAWRTENVEANHPLRGIQAEARRSESHTHIHLQRLTPTEVDALATHFHNLTPALRARLYERTEGLPYFLIEYLNAQPDSGEVLLPSGIREIQLARLARLDEVARQLITTAAVIGRSFDFDTLKTASGRSEEETIAALEDLLSRGLLIEKNSDEGQAFDGPSVRTPRYDFSHETIHHVVSEQTSFARRRLLHRRVAEALIQQTRSSDESAGRIAHHLQQAGQEARAAGFYYRAGEHARRLFANIEALAHYQNALALGYPEPQAVYEALGDLRTLRGEYRQAVTCYEKSASLADAAALPFLERKLANLHHRRGDYPLAASHFRTALELLEGSSREDSLYASIHIDWSHTASRQGDLVSGRTLAEKGLESAIAGQDSIVESQANNVLGILARRDGDLTAARQRLERALETAGTHLPSRIAALNNLALVCADEGRFDESIRLTRLALADCRLVGDLHREAALHNHLADRLHANGQNAEAMQELKRAVEIFAEIGKEAGDLEPEIWKLVEW